MVALLYPVILTTALILCAYLYSPNVHTDNLMETNVIRYILLWTDPTSAPLSFLGHGFDAFERNNCEYTNCYVSHNVSDLGGVMRSNVIVFNGRHLPKTHWPRYRMSNQKYVYANMESAQNHPVCDRHLNGFFNWTWTYKLDSDLRWGYVTVYDLAGRVVGPKTDMEWLKMDPVDSRTKNRLMRKSRAASWFVSNCKTKSLRERFAKKISKEMHRLDLTLDMYGSCGRAHECPKNEARCGELLEKNYYFYFALENSLSEDYVTEKVLTALRHYTVPVVFGGADYSRFLPPGSYLDARELGAKRLATRMAAIIDNHKNGNASLYHDFFRWRNHYTFKQTSETEDLCNICRLLNDPAAMSKETVYRHFLQWWNGKDSVCRNTFIMFWVTLIGAAIGYLIWKVLAGDEDPLDKLPGPWKWPVVGNAFVLSRISQEEYFALVRDCVKQYGDRFVFKMFHTRVLNICSAKDAEVVLSHSRNITKSRAYSFVEPWLGTGLLLSTGNKWHRRRKLLTPTFHFNILKNFAIVMEERSRTFVRQLRETRGAEAEVASLIKDFTLYTICETAMGICLDLDRSKPASDYLDAVINIGPLILERHLSIWLRSDWIYNQLPAGKRHRKYLKTIHSFADNLIHGRKQQRLKNLEELETVGEDGVKRRLAFLDLLLEVESKEEIDLEGIREEVNTFMFEGHDTTANALTFGIMLLADHPEVQDKVRHEYRRIIGDADRAFTMSDFPEMKYLEAVIKETLRLYPSVPFIGRTITEDFVLDDVLVRAGAQVAIRIYDLQRREELFPDPHTFKPERFLEPNHKPFAFVPFSAGPRNCIGQRFAMMEMKCVLGMMCNSFRLEPRIRGHRPALIADVVLRSNEPIYVRFLPR